MASILLVDDEPEIVYVTKKVLEKEGNEVFIAKNGNECLRFLNKNELPDLILLDIMMPLENGWEVCRKIKSDNRTKHIPVVMFTVRTSKESVEKSLNYAMADAQIDKPFNISDLVRTVKRFLKK